MVSLVSTSDGRQGEELVDDLSSVASEELVFAKLKDDSAASGPCRKTKKNQRKKQRQQRQRQSRRRSRSRGAGGDKKADEDDQAAREGRSLRRSRQAVQNLVSRISFDDDDTTVSSLGMGCFDGEDTDVEDDLLLNNSSDRSLVYYNENEEDSAVRIKTQIKMLRRNSMARFQATPIKNDSLPALPTCCSERILRGRDRDAFWGEEHDLLTPLAGAAAAQQDGTEDAPMNPPPRRGSLPTDLHRVVPSLPSDLPSAGRRGSLPTDFKVLPPRTLSDRWSSESPQSLQRDCELVRTAFQRASSLRKSNTGSAATATTTTTISSTSRTTTSSVSGNDTMLVPPRRCA